MVQEKIKKVEASKVESEKNQIGSIAKNGFVVGSIFDDKTIDLFNFPFAGPAEYDEALTALQDVGGYTVWFPTAQK